MQSNSDKQPIAENPQPPNQLYTCIPYPISFNPNYPSLQPPPAQIFSNPPQPSNSSLIQPLNPKTEPVAPPKQIQIQNLDTSESLKTANRWNTIVFIVSLLTAVIYFSFVDSWHILHNHKPWRLHWNKMPTRGPNGYKRITVWHRAK